jgi:malonyl-CoA O-methyltransferase
MRADNQADSATGVDSAAARRFFGLSAARDAPQVLSREVERRMADRLELVRLVPERFLDAGCGTGAGVSLLSRRYSKALPVALDSAFALLSKASKSRPFLSRAWNLISGDAPQWTCADFGALPFQSGSFQLVWSNLALAWAEDPLKALREFRRVLGTNGLLMFSTYGPDTLKELRAAFSSVDDKPHTMGFIDMHDLGDMLAAAGFAAPVMDMEVITLAYADIDGLVRDLRMSGQVNSAQGRRRALLGTAAYRRLRNEYESMRQGGKLPATIEIIYGHAWRGQPRAEVDGFSVVRMPEGRHASGHQA